MKNLKQRLHFNGGYRGQGGGPPLYPPHFKIQIFVEDFPHEIFRESVRLPSSVQLLSTGLIGYQDEKDESSWLSRFILAPKKTRMKPNFLVFPFMLLVVGSFVLVFSSCLLVVDSFLLVFTIFY